MPDPSANLGDSGASVVQHCFLELDETGIAVIACIFRTFLRLWLVLQNLVEVWSFKTWAVFVGGCQASNLGARKKELPLLWELVKHRIHLPITLRAPGMFSALCNQGVGYFQVTCQGWCCRNTRYATVTRTSNQPLI